MQRQPAGARGARAGGGSTALKLHAFCVFTRLTLVLLECFSPFLWVDKRGNFHIINHRFDTNETSSCYSSHISAHVFSPDGKAWHVLSPAVEPYTHTVEYSDGSSFTFVTLERPNIHFDPSGQMTHINLAADLTTKDDGCPLNGKPRACAECKFYRHCGTTIIALDV